MKKLIPLTLIAAIMIMVGCVNIIKSGSNSGNALTAVVHDTVWVAAMPADTLTYNLPCQVISIHPEKPGKALLFLWLHGGVRDRKIHSYFKHPNHYDYCAADDSVIHYLRRHDIKAIALLPMCHKADSTQCVYWDACYDDVKHMIDNLVNKGLVDARRIYVAGSSDGGMGAWNYVAHHPEMFAAAISMSCSEPQMTSVPTYFYNTADEKDCTQQVADLKRKGANILDYRHCPQLRHGGDATLCTDELLTEFFSHKK